MGAGPTALAGGLLSVASTVPFVFLGARTSYALLCLVLVTRGAGIGLSLMPAMTAAYGVLPAGKIADATPQLNILQRTGGSIGTAVFTVILTRQLAHSASPAAAANAFGTTFAWVLAITAVAAAPTRRLGRLATVDFHGAPQNNPVSFRYNPDLGTIDIGGHAMGASRKFRNIAANAQVAFVVDDIASYQPWKVRCVEIRAAPRPSAASRRQWPGSPPRSSASIPTASSASASTTLRLLTKKAERSPARPAPAGAAAGQAAGRDRHRAPGA